jgi:hypothetical protein
LLHSARAPLRPDRRGVVEDVPEADGGAAAPDARFVEGGLELAPGAERMLVSEEDGGTKRAGGGGKQPRAQRADLAPRDRQAPSCIPLVRELPQTRKLEDVHPRRDAELLGLVGTRGNEHRCLRVELDECARDRQIAPYVAEAQPVVGVKEEAARTPHSFAVSSGHAIQTLVSENVVVWLPVADKARYRYR